MVAEYLYHAGDLPDTFFVIQWGTVDVILKDKDIPIGSVGSGQPLGEMAFFVREKRLASAITREPTHLICLPFAKLDQVLVDHPNLALLFYRRACVVLTQLLRAMAPDVNRRYL
jgi:CRP-like cAMP-binding protein